MNPRNIRKICFYMGKYFWPRNKGFSGRWKLWIFPVTFCICVCLYLIYRNYVIFERDVSDKKYYSLNGIFEDKDNLEYAIVIDAGSSGSRVYIYVWPPHKGNLEHLLDIHQLTDEFNRPLVKKITPGLSSFADEPFKASDYLYPLLQFAAENVPIDKHVQTPLFILATAGMRLLSEDIQESILNDLRVDIPQNFSFHFPPTNVEVISGKQEGIYLWIAINYLLGNFDHTFENDDKTKIVTNSSIWRKPTVGMLEMGGASLQIAYEVTDDDYNNEIQVGVSFFLFSENIFEKKFNVKPSKLIILIQFFINLFYRNKTAPLVILDPCLSKETTDFNDKNTISIPNQNISSVLFKGTGNFNECYKRLISYLNYTCEGMPCNSGIPHLGLNFSKKDFYGFSEFWYTMEDVLRIGGIYNYKKFQKSARDYCATRWSVLQDRFQRRVYPLADKKRLKYQCFKSAWMSVVLHEGLKLPVDYKGLRSAALVQGQHVQWSLGAVLYRTRYFPLRALHKTVGQNSLSIWKVNAFYQFLFYGCIIIVFTAITIYLCRLQRFFCRPRKFLSHTNIISMEKGLIPSKEPLLWR
ncbi:ectonucleoside triphosphate diphosphohydrolase 4-like [Centruroides sculpturatus]|uniref:ectonucleoside triphosphate diphosphohydrolase 4-like n=1 Tax=Centruroides sculpturatus TaxID=218467 RepID=UPI000C6EA339|nr:ectonucleoside triphosphate diphosphohydrolase 4-like [Centruroides sculpturatus]